MRRAQVQEILFRENQKKLHNIFLVKVIKVWLMWVVIHENRQRKMCVGCCYASCFERCESSNSLDLGPSHIQVLTNL